MIGKVHSVGRRIRLLIELSESEVRLQLSRPSLKVEDSAVHTLERLAGLVIAIQCREEVARAPARLEPIEPQTEADPSML